MAAKNQINLKETYPVSPLLLMKELTPLLLTLLCLCLLFFILPNIFDLSNSEGEYLKKIDPAASPSFFESVTTADTHLLIKYFLILLFIWIVIKGIYLKLREVFLVYKIENKNLIVRQGVLRRATLMLPVDKLTEVYVERSWLDWLYGLATLVFYAPATHSTHGIKITGLAHRDALKFETFAHNFIANDPDN